MVRRHSAKEQGSLVELRSLAQTAGYNVVGAVEQTRKEDSRYQIGRGKVNEIVQLIKENSAERIIFENRLKSVQAYNLARETGVEAIDRFQLILEIFTRRASTTEAKLQIQLAKLRYELAHARERVRLARMEEQPGFMGLGAYEVDVYHEAVQRQVHAIREKLEKIKTKRSLQRRRRRKLGFQSISLAGYTYAGKTTLFNALTKEGAPTGEGLFTTLATKTRTLELRGRRVLLTDTVGFIDRLPLTLIEAFKSTLEETVFSDLILLIADVSEPLPEVEKKLTTCLDTLQRIGAHGIPLVTAFNKIDLLSESEVRRRTELMGDVVTNIVAISALHNRNLGALENQLSKHLESHVKASFSIPLSDRAISFISWLFRYVDVKGVKYSANSAEVQFEAAPVLVEKVFGRLDQFDGVTKKAVDGE
ncbi:MAG: GTPase HflX [Candidatus Bathyarchaeota archaeon]|nr:GTPase HflX [Candidatus Bathyarchaeota archaeon]